MQKPNILFIMADQQRADSFGEGRHPCANYPNLERLKEEAANFTHFFTAAIACGPSRNCFLTGLHPWQTGVTNSRFNMYGSDSWMSALRDNGYMSISVGKTHMAHSGSFHKQIDLGKSFGKQGGWDHFKPEASPENKEQFFDSVFLPLNMSVCLSALIISGTSTPKISANLFAIFSIFSTATAT